MLDKIAQSFVYEQLDMFKTYYEGYGFCKKILKSIKNHITIRYYDIEEIYTNVKDGNLNIGDVIETNGILLEYAQIFSPYTHVSTMFGKCEKVGEKEITKNGKSYIEGKMKLVTSAFQPPVQKIPSYDDLGYAFLYDSRFRGFEHVFDSENNITVNEYSKPILVIYDRNKYNKQLNKEALIRGRIIELPLSYVSNLGVQDETIREICGNFIDLYNENKNFICLSIIDGETSVKYASDVDFLPEISVPLYIECELEKFSSLYNGDNSKASDFISNIIPFLPQKIDSHFPAKVITTPKNIGTPFVSTEDIFTVFREPNVLGFYTTAKVFQLDEYKEKLKIYSNTVNNFAIDYKNFSRKNFGVKDKLCLNFLFDYSKQFLFDSRGALYSTGADISMQEDDSKKYIQPWLKDNAIEI